MSKFFPKLYDIVMYPLEYSGLRCIRKSLIHKASGQVLEIGSGTGLNFPYYDKPRVAKLLAIEPDSLMRKQSLSRADQSNIPIEIVLTGAEDIPFPDNSFDTVVSTLVFCTIPHPTKALQEIRRVCKPGGKILLCEHVRLNHSLFGLLQDWLTPFWKHIAGGCHVNRDTLQMIKDSGFEITDVKHYFYSIFLTIEGWNKKSAQDKFHRIR